MNALRRFAERVTCEELRAQKDANMRLHRSLIVQKARADALAVNNRTKAKEIGRLRKALRPFVFVGAPEAAK